MKLDENESKKQAEINGDVLTEVTGGKEDLTIKPNDGEFWHSWNPAFIISDESIK